MADQKDLLANLAAARQRWSLPEETVEQQVTKFRIRLNKVLAEAVYSETYYWTVAERDARLLLGMPGGPQEGFIAAAVAGMPMNELALFLQTVIDREQVFRENNGLGPGSSLGDRLQTAISLSPGAPIEVHKAGDRYILYPAGNALLDGGLVNPVLDWLTPHPAALEKFQAALVGSLTGVGRRRILDDLRFSLEQLLKDLLGNDKSLENQQTALGGWLKERGLNAQVGNMFQTLAKQFALYQNDAVKHDDDSHPEELEFMLYLTANFMQLLLRLGQHSSEPRE